MKASSWGRERRGASAGLNRATRTPWGLVGLLVAAGIVAAFHVGKVPPSIPSIRDELDASLGQAGWLLSMVNLIAALGGMAIASTADRFGHRRLILLGTALSVAASGLGAFAGSVDIPQAYRFRLAARKPGMEPSSTPRRVGIMVWFVVWRPPNLRSRWKTISFMRSASNNSVRYSSSNSNCSAFSRAAKVRSNLEVPVSNIQGVASISSQGNLGNGVF